MFWEIWQYLSTPAEGYLREMGYLHELIGIQRRARRCRQHWKPHLERTRDFILQDAQRCRNRSHAVILGSGWLLDVPLEELAGLFDRVDLIDILHPRLAKRRASHYRNVHLRTLDVSGITKPIYDLMQQTAMDELPAPTMPTQAGFENVDFMISVNTLSQLSFIPLEFLDRCLKSKNLDGLSQEKRNNFIREVIRQHVKLLSLADVSCLITDVECMTFDRQDRLVDQRDLMAGLRLIRAKADREWNWDIAPYGEAEPKNRLSHRVICLSQPSVDDWSF
jgi:hypothetical protein